MSRGGPSGNLSRGGLAASDELLDNTTPLQYWRNYVARRLQLSPAQLEEYWEDFANAPNKFGTAGTGANGANDLSVLGMFGITSGALANGFREYFLGGGAYSGTILKRIPGGATGKWAMLLRGKLGTAMNANAEALTGARNDGGTAFANFPFNGSVSAANYSLNTDQTDLDSGLAIDTNPHDWLVLRDGTTTFFEIDGVLKASHASAYPGANVGPHIRVINGATAAARTIYFEHAGFWAPQI